MTFCQVLSAVASEVSTAERTDSHIREVAAERGLKRACIVYLTAVRGGVLVNGGLIDWRVDVG